jgi:nicotinamidase-related amidase
MPLDLAALVDPRHTAVVTSEIQRGVIGDLSALPELAKQGREVIPQIARLVEGARQAGAQVIHCIAERRADNKGMNRNARLFGYMAKAEPKLLPGSPATEVVPEVKLHDSDVVLARLHGLSPFSGTELDFVLRNLDVTTVVAVGVSVNVAITNLTFDCVNAGYQVVIPIDAVAGTPRSYVEQVFEHTLRNVATLARTDDLVGAWSKRRALSPAQRQPSKTRR